MPGSAFALALGFTLTAVPFYLAVWLAGDAVFGPLRETREVWFVAAGGTLLLLLADLGIAGLRTPTWRRQTPQWFMHRFKPATAALLWGLDAGLVVTTFRFTSLTWAALTFTVLGLVPPWAGAVYALGFVVPELASQLAVPWRKDGSGGGEPQWLMEALLGIRPRMRLLAKIALGVAAVVTATAPWALNLT